MGPNFFFGWKEGSAKIHTFKGVSKENQRFFQGIFGASIDPQQFPCWRILKLCIFLPKLLRCQLSARLGAGECGHPHPKIWKKNMHFLWQLWVVFLIAEHFWMKIPGCVFFCSDVVKSAGWRSLCWFWRGIFHLPTTKCTPKTSTEILKRRQSRFYARSFLIPWNSYSLAVLVTTHDSGSSEFGYTWPRYHLGVNSQVLHGMVTPED